ncbi:hypothetical protein V5O48_015810 [Marasmius crinis-equi]|uniref:Uncharacterized protein n=1 Tax=Marasmius crinis-equi TaxID=585013 RepID=A0ABR3ETL1_9AGAR
MTTSMIEIELSDNLNREHPTLISHLNAALRAQNLNLFLSATEGPLVFPGRKTISWSGLGDRVAMVWLNPQEVLELVLEGQMINFVNEFRLHCGSPQQVWAILYGLHVDTEYKMCEAVIENGLAQAEVFTGVHFVPVATQEKAVLELISIG